MGKIKSVLFVCTGNSCRSVMAEGLLKKRLKELGKTGIIVRSAGVRALDGLPPTREAIEAVKEYGVSLDGFKSTGITAEIIRESDLILVMAEMHKEDIVRLVPEAASKTFFLREYGRPAGSKPVEKDIPDPIGQQVDGYKACIELIKEDIERVAKILSASAN